MEVSTGQRAGSSGRCGAATPDAIALHTRAGLRSDRLDQRSCNAGCWGGRHDLTVASASDIARRRAASGPSSWDSRSNAHRRIRPCPVCRAPTNNAGAHHPEWRLSWTSSSPWMMASKIVRGESIGSFEQVAESARVSPKDACRGPSAQWRCRQKPAGCHRFIVDGHVSGDPVVKIDLEPVSRISRRAGTPKSPRRTRTSRPPGREVSVRDEPGLLRWRRSPWSLPDATDDRCTAVTSEAHSPSDIRTPSRAAARLRGDRCLTPSLLTTEGGDGTVRRRRPPSASSLSASSWLSESDPRH